MTVAALPWAPTVEDESIRNAQGAVMLTADERDNLTEQMEVAFREATPYAQIGGKSFDPRDVDWHKTLTHGRTLRKFREAVAETSFPQLLRVGVQSLLFDAYASVGTIYPDLVRMVDSTSYEELYAPLYGAEIPKQVLAGQKFEDSRIMGLDYRLKNKKFGRILGVERELIEDDQTGQIQQRASQMGQRVRYVEEQDVMNQILAATYNATLTNVVFTPGTPAGATNPTPAPGQLSQPLLEQLAIQALTMKDPLGSLMLMQPDTLLISPTDNFNARKLLGSALQPSVPGSAGQNASTASSGGTGWTMTMNPLQGAYDLKMSRFLTTTGLDTTHGAWFLLQAKTSIVFQDRVALEMTPEAYNAGESFARDVYRWRVRRRFASGVVESRYLLRGN